MLRHSPQPASDAAPTAGASVAAGLVLAAFLTLLVVSVADGAWADGGAPFPFAWRDVALIHLLCAIPLAVVLAVYAACRLPAAASVALAAVALAVGVVPLTATLQPEPVVGVALRAVSALGVALAVALAAVVLAGRHRGGNERAAFPLAGALVAALVLVVPPASYSAARVRHDAGQLGEYLEQSRFGEARTLARRTLVLDPGAAVRGRPLPEVAAEVEGVTRELESRVKPPLSLLATPADRLDRATWLAVLGRTDEALEVLSTVRHPALAAEAGNLRGTIHETRAEWESGLEAYRAARGEWERRPPSPGRTAGLVRAATGEAYCSRKLGRYAEAEASYLRVLELSPTAESHFLLAQFYEDTQQTAKAREHARAAVALDPARYGRDGEKLVRKLSVFHFGCLGVLAAERARP